MPVTYPPPLVQASSATAPPTAADNDAPATGGDSSSGSGNASRRTSALPYLPTTVSQLESLCNTDGGPILESALVADVTYQPRKKMVLGVQTEVDAVVGFGKVSRQMISGDEPTTIVQVTASCAVALQLEGAGFDVPNSSRTVNFLGPELQKLPNQKVIWEVTPTVSGEHDLDLVITPEDLFTTTGSTISQDDGTTKTQVIAVTAVAKPITHQLWDFVNTPILILIITLIAGSSAVTGLFRRRRKGHGHLKVEGSPPAKG